METAGDTYSGASPKRQTLVEDPFYLMGLYGCEQPLLNMKAGTGALLEGSIRFCIIRFILTLEVCIYRVSDIITAGFIINWN